MKTTKRKSAQQLCRSVIKHEALKRDGSLKKGYKYIKGGKIVKVKNN